MITIEGKSVFGGVSIGKLMFYKRNEKVIRRTHVDDVDAEWKRFEEAKNTAIDQLKVLYDKAIEDVGEANAMIFEIHQMMLDDLDYLESIEGIIRTQSVNAEYAVSTTADNFAQMFASMDDAYMQGRAADVKDVSERVLDILCGVATAVGGGMIRDIVLGVIPPAVFRNPVYALVSVLASCIVFFIFYFKRELLEGHRRETYDKFMLVLDSVGLGIFTVVGVNAGIRQGHMDNAFLLVFLGTITGVGGGLLRDMMASVPPYIFVKHIYACASIIGAIVCVYMNRFVGNVEAMVVSSIVVVLIRYLAAHYHWNLPRLSPHEEQNDRNRN